MVDIDECIKDRSSKVIDIEIDGNPAKLVTGQREPYYVEIEKENISNPREFKKNIKNFREEFINVIQVKDNQEGDGYYLYEVYLSVYF